MVNYFVVGKSTMYRTIQVYKLLLIVLCEFYKNNFQRDFKRFQN